jgi:hypothetical protein
MAISPGNAQYYVFLSSVAHTLELFCETAINQALVMRSLIPLESTSVIEEVLHDDL